MHDREVEEDTEVQGEDPQSVQGMRQAAGLYEEVRNLQNLFQRTCTQGTYPWSDEVELVEVRHGN